MRLKLQPATSPIVFVIDRRPGQAGLVASLSRPGGNLDRALAFFQHELDGKALGLLIETWYPEQRRVAVLVNPRHYRGTISPTLRRWQAAAAIRAA